MGTARARGPLPMSSAAVEAASAEPGRVGAWRGGSCLLSFGPGGCEGTPPRPWPSAGLCCAFTAPDLATAPITEADSSFHVLLPRATVRPQPPGESEGLELGRSTCMAAAATPSHPALMFNDACCLRCPPASKLSLCSHSSLWRGPSPLHLSCRSLLGAALFQSRSSLDTPLAWSLPHSATLFPALPASSNQSVRSSEDRRWI